MSSPRIVTVPNLLSFARIPLAVAFLAVQHVPTRVGLVVAASLTDFFDGWFARRGQTSRLGALLDPIADKLFIFAAVSAFLLDGALSTRDYFVLLSRDFATAVGFLVAAVMPSLDPRGFRARWPGKVLTVLQLLALLALLLEPRLFPPLVPWIALVSALAIADYTLALHRQRART